MIAVGYFDEMGQPIFKLMTAKVLVYCAISGFQILYVKDE